jgi:hypothetical protein
MDTWAGSENVVEQVLACFPQAELFALVDFVPEDNRARLGGGPITTSFIQHLPLARPCCHTYGCRTSIGVQKLRSFSAGWP